MYYFNPDKIKQAYDLLNNCKDLAEAKKDVDQIDMIISNNLNMLNKLFLQQYDEELRQKYIEINELQILADATKWSAPCTCYQTYQPSIKEIERLKFDKFGIMARILKSSREIVNLSDFFDRQYIESN